MALLAMAWLVADATHGPSAPKPASAHEDHPAWPLEVRRLGPERGETPVVIVLHGFGAPGDDLVPLARTLRAGTSYRMVVPAAPMSLPQGGRAWWPIDFASRQQQYTGGEGRDLRGERPAGLAQARAQLEALVGRVGAAYGVPRRKIALVGFSQGAMLALDALLHMAEPVGCLGFLSGSFISERDWRRRLEARRAAVPVFMSHGTRDTILPFALSRALRDALRQHGHAVSWHPFEGGHTIPAPVVRALRSFLKGCFGSAQSAKP
jgi:phospholipase/carboxylesterase